MRFRSGKSGEILEGDLTPMIDMTFQLIAFFMVLVNFSDADQNERITLPLSELAKPPDAPPPSRITLQLTDNGTVIFGAKEVAIQELAPILLREKQVIEASRKRTARETTIIIRADRAAKTGEVQEVIEVCQGRGFEKFALRAKQGST